MYSLKQTISFILFRRVIVMRINLINGFFLFSLLFSLRSFAFLHYCEKHSHEHTSLRCPKGYTDGCKIKVDDPKNAKKKINLTVFHVCVRDFHANKSMFFDLCTEENLNLCPPYEVDACRQQNKLSKFAICVHRAGPH